jgi:uncharacterized membrane protein
MVLVMIKTILRGGYLGQRSKKDDPVEILEKRYARGEIEDEEFKRRRNELVK